MSTLFHLRPKTVEKPVVNHPWERTIKGQYSNRIKHAHNSIKNPHYPKDKEKVPDSDRIKFTVVGDRITKEFIYCSTLVNGLHKYRWKKFDVPIIRGVTTIEWPEVWKNLKILHGGITHCLQSRVAVLMNDKILGGEQELKEFVETHYIYHLTLDYYNDAVKQFALFIRSSGRPCAYMHISIDEEHIGTLIFMLYSDIVPYTSENFLRLCKDTKGGYGGTPIHRIVKDGWIQGGGFGLKSTDLDCENFIVPPDRRGLLCMANDGRHIDCSTQFFVLLQPAPWMAQKYVAFGQLIEGENTLAKIESVPTWYESPTSNIIIYKAGVFNMECMDIMINKGANEYIDGHIEDLNALGEILYENLITRVFLEIELKIVQRMEKELLGAEEVMVEEEGTEGTEGTVRATKRFIRRKGEPREIKVNANANAKRQSIKSADFNPPDDEHENNEFDVEEYEMEESSYQHQSIVSSSLIVKPQRPYYIPLTDVPYPGEVDSTFDLKRFLKGDYCLESDLDTKISKKPLKPKHLPYYLDALSKDESNDSTEWSLESDEEKEIIHFIQNNIDRVSFAGDVVKNIGRGHAMFNLFEDERKSQPVSDDALRRMKVAIMDTKSRENKKVSVSNPDPGKITTTIKRRQTGFVRPEDLEMIRRYDNGGDDHDDDDDDENDADMSHEDTETHNKAVRIAAPKIDTSETSHTQLRRRPTGFVRMSSNYDDLGSESLRPSVMYRLYETVSHIDGTGPTLKDYKPRSEVQQKNMLLKMSPTLRMTSDDSYTNTKERYIRKSAYQNNSQSLENVLNLQHGKKLSAKISSDYVKTMDQMGHRLETSIRTIEYAKTRPSMTVSEYQQKNLKYNETLKKKLDTVKKSADGDGGSKVIDKSVMSSTSLHLNLIKIIKKWNKSLITQVVFYKNKPDSIKHFINTE